MSRRLLLVGWEAADWKFLHPLLDAGEMPTLHRLVEHGASGGLLSVAPQVQALQWASIATGKRAWQHGVCHPTENSSQHRQSAALWEILSHESRRSLVVGWPATHATRRGSAIVVSDRYPEPTAPPGIKPWPPAAPGTYWPVEIGAKLDPLRVSPAEIAADIISRYVPLWDKVDQKRDRRLGQLRVLLAGDFSYQSAVADLLGRKDWDFAAVRFSALGGISQLGAAADEFQFYRNLVNGHYRMLDLMLSRLIELAGPEVAVMVVSNNGRSSHGIFVAHGPGFSPDALLLGASILDVAPTVLTWFGLPIGDDMEGRVLLESFSETASIQRVPDWDSSLDMSSQVLPQSEEAMARPESDGNFAQSCLEAGRYEEALPALTRLFRGFPENPENCHVLFQCQLALGLLVEAEETLEVLLETVPAGLMSHLPRAELAWAKRDVREARMFVSQIRQLACNHPGALRRLGILLLRLREWDALAELARRALQMDENDPIAWVGLAEAQLRKGAAQEAMESARRAISLKYFLPEAHFVLARAHVAQGQWLQARDAMQTLLKLQPNHRKAPAYARRLGSH
jgi:hypothetical protein